MKPKYYLDNATPLEIEYTLLSIDWEEGLSKKEFQERFLNRGFQVGKKFDDNFRRLVDLEIFEKKASKYYLTNLGQKMKKVLLLNKEVFFEIFHYAQYRQSALDNGREYFYTYKIIVEFYTSTSHLGSTKELISQVIAILHDKYGTEKIAIDARSISKTINWLGAMGSLSPIKGETRKKYIELRETLGYCETLLLAIDYQYRFKKIRYGFPILLDEEMKHAICHFCLLKEDLLDRYLNLLNERSLIRLNMGSAGISIILDNEIDLAKWLEDYIL